MTLKTRRALFYSSVFLFIIAAATVIFYSAGFRVDFENRLITETGGIYVKSKPTGVEIALDDEPIKNEVGILNTGTLMDDLTPGTYHLVLNLDNYSGWQKNVDVLRGTVAIFDSITLVSNDREKIRDGVDEFFFANGLFVTRLGKAIEFNGNPIIGDAITHFADDGSVVTQDSDTGDYYLSNAFDLNSPLNISAMFNNLKELRLDLPGAVRIQKIEPYPFDGTRFIVMTGRAIYTLDTRDQEIEQIDPSARDFIIAGNEVLWINDSGLSSYNLLFSTKSLIEGKPAAEIKLFGADSSGNRIVALDSERQLFYIDRKTSTSTIISDETVFFSISPDGHSLMFVNSDGVMHVFNFEWKKGDRGKQLVNLVNVGAPLGEVFWYGNNAYLFTKDMAGNLKFIEISDSEPINEVLISEKVTSYAYNGKDGFLYYGNDSGVWQLEI